MLFSRNNNLATDDYLHFQHCSVGLLENQLVRVKKVKIIHTF